MDRVRRLSTFRAVAALLLGLASIATGELAACWQLAPHRAAPAALMAAAAVTLAAAIVGLLAQSGCLAIALLAGPLLRRSAALRRKSWGAAFQRQRNPDAAGRARPRAPTAVPAAA